MEDRFDRSFYYPLLQPSEQGEEKRKDRRRGERRKKVRRLDRLSKPYSPIPDISSSKGGEREKERGGERRKGERDGSILLSLALPLITGRGVDKGGGKERFEKKRKRREQRKRDANPVISYTLLQRNTKGEKRKEKRKEGKHRHLTSTRYDYSLRTLRRARQQERRKKRLVGEGQDRNA